LLFRVVTKTVRDLLRADKPFFMHFIYVQNRCSTLYFYFALNTIMDVYQYNEAFWKDLFDGITVRPHT
ncbi:hypothetical protein Q0N88_23745, partial [Bacillus thuringiensis]